MHVKMNLPWRCLILAGYSIVTSMAVPADAQILDPSIAEFEASADHDGQLTDGTNVVTRYDLEFYFVGAADPFQVTGLGKPEPVAGLISVDLAEQLVVTPAPAIIYEARVAAVGPGGMSRSELSNQFLFTETVPCSYVVAPLQHSVSDVGGQVSFVLTTADGCQWTATSQAAWLAVSPTAGSGSTTITVTAVSNPGPTERTGTLSVAGQTISVIQAAPTPECAYGVDPAAASAASSSRDGAVTGLFKLTTGPECSWTAISSHGWLRVRQGTGKVTTTLEGSGSSTIEWSLRSNKSNTRVGTVTVGGAVFTVTQAGRNRSQRLSTVADLTVELEQGESETLTLGPSVLERGFIAELVGAGDDRGRADAYVHPVLVGGQWLDVLHVVAADGPPAAPVPVRVRVHAVSSSPVFIVDATLMPDMMHSFSVGPIGQTNTSYVAEISPTGFPSDPTAVETKWCAQEKCAAVDPDLDGGAWSTVVKVYSAAEFPVEATIRVYEVDGSLIRPSAPDQSGTVRPAVTDTFVDAYVTPELTDRGWADALYVQAPEGAHVTAGDASVGRLEIGTLDEQIESLRDDIDDVATAASLDPHRRAFLHARLNDIGFRLSVDNRVQRMSSPDSREKHGRRGRHAQHAQATSLLLVFDQELRSMVESGVMPPALAQALSNPVLALANRLSELFETSPSLSIRTRVGR